MKVTPLNKIPFSEQQFMVEMNGLELAVIKYLVSHCATGDAYNMGGISYGIYQTLYPIVGLDHDSFKQEIPTIPLNHITQAAFKQKIDESDK